MSSEDVFLTSWRRLDQDENICLGHTPLIQLQDVFKTSSTHLQNFFAKTSCQDVLKTTSKRLQDALQRCLQDIFKTFSRRIIKLNCFSSPVFKTSSRRIQYVFETNCEDEYLQRDLPRLHFWEIYGQGTKSPRVNSLHISILLNQCF